MNPAAPPEARPHVAEASPFSVRGWTSDVAGHIERVAHSALPVIIRGETGVGKEALARRIHAATFPTDRPFTRVNCPLTAPDDVRQSYRSAFAGTILFVELGAADMRFQATLQALLDESHDAGNGSAPPPRTIATFTQTSADPEPLVRIRPELYYRLNVIDVQLRPLRERSQDIVPLAIHYLETYRRGPACLEPALERALTDYAWPGNLRELENVLREHAVLDDIEVLLVRLGAGSRLAGDVPRPLPGQRSAEAHAILAALHATRWHRKSAAARLGIAYKAFLYRMKKLGIGQGGLDA